MSQERIAVVGCGYWGKNLVRNFAELGALAAVVDPHAPTADALAEAYGVPALSFEEVLADPLIAGIATASPAHLHREIALSAIAAGKHVFVEKPIALSLEDGHAMREAAERAGLVLMVGHLLQYHPIYRRLREMVAEGAIGRLAYCYSNRLSMGKLRTEEDVIWSFAPHDISMILGLSGQSPSSVSTFGSSIVVGEGVMEDLADSGHLHLAFPSGLKAHVFTSWISPFKEQRLVAIGETGSLVFDDTRPWNQKLVLTPHAVGAGPALSKGEVREIAVEEAEPLKEECRHFLGAVGGEHPARTDAAEALAVLEVLMRAEPAAMER